MEVDSTAGDSWSQLLDTRSFNRSVYVLITVDNLLQPAPETMLILHQDLRHSLEKRLIETANAFRRAFIDSGGFAATVRFFSQPDGGKAHTGEARRGNAVALRVLKACLFGDGSEAPTADVENVVPPDEAGSELLRSLSSTEGLLRTLTSMVVNDSGISSSTIMDVLRFLRLLFRSQRAAESFVKLPDGLARRLLVTLLTREEASDTLRTSSALNASMNVRSSVHDLILQTPLLADEALPWLVNAVNDINFESENASELFDTLERLVADIVRIRGLETELEELRSRVNKIREQQVVTTADSLPAEKNANDNEVDSSPDTEQQKLMASSPQYQKLVQRFVSTLPASMDSSASSWLSL